MTASKKTTAAAATTATTSTTTLIVGLSGCSCSGKSTLARLLRDVFPGCLVVHEDDFYKPASQLPRKNGFVDWDCAEAIDVPALADALSYVREHASLPPDLTTRHGRQDQEFINGCSIHPSVISELQHTVRSSLPPPTMTTTPSPPPRVCIVEGFLLYGPLMTALEPLLDVKCFVRASRARVTARRRDRDAYMCARWEGFWPDPPGYVDEVVWPNYVRAHAWMFEAGDVEGRFLGEERLRRRECDGGGGGVEVMREGAAVDADMEGTLRWFFGVVLKELQKRAPR
ncbi:nicotinamide riboside kinase 1 [Purpureocillium lilacinum]|uniref:Nicotinamide riboside kinase 1 n=1 Tax=Purpureocillium lilacinum TaxID=33203 RepID=A0A179HLE8_PURLI|nr:nicotinamide riboside kinase 1 [Purpureocillium lilacinum]OAQ91246.1 nicotinamide riboside kinase 1 [Purpureocillium lilacinum]